MVPAKRIAALVCCLTLLSFVASVQASEPFYDVVVVGYSFAVGTTTPLGPMSFVCPPNVVDCFELPIEESCPGARPDDPEGHEEGGGDLMKGLNVSKPRPPRPSPCQTTAVSAIGTEDELWGSTALALCAIWTEQAICGDQAYQTAPSCGYARLAHPPAVFGDVYLLLYSVLVTEDLSICGASTVSDPQAPIPEGNTIKVPFEGDC